MWEFDVALPVDYGLVEYVFTKFIYNFFDESALNRREVSGGVVVFVAREVLFKVGIGVYGVGEAYLYGDSESVHGDFVVAREGGGTSGVSYDFAFYLQVAVAVGDAEWCLRRKHIS